MGAKDVAEVGRCRMHNAVEGYQKPDVGRNERDENTQTPGVCRAFGFRELYATTAAFSGRNARLLQSCVRAAHI
jgi:hypothetical protein